ncbi:MULTISPECIES: hypothetical protein [Streptomyces]|uniref:hypothetical protein n=1 Tax=Streptomyces lycopersici TaxID=2974589 RepID=UPI0021CF476D|nr:hypothetical protein [Streptomyces sp. NEAU-383]
MRQRIGHGIVGRMRFGLHATTWTEAKPSASAGASNVALIILAGRSSQCGTSSGGTSLAMKAGLAAAICFHSWAEMSCTTRYGGRRADSSSYVRRSPVQR